MTQASITAPEVTAYIKCKGIDKPIQKTFWAGIPLGPRIRAWCQDNYLTLESWETDEDD